jgi:hypothetical protein
VSYNIDSTIVLECDAKISVEDVLRFRAFDDLPEDHFLEDGLAPAVDGFHAITAEEFRWRGELSGSYWDEVFCEHIAPKIVGRIKFEVVKQ